MTTKKLFSSLLAVLLTSTGAAYAADTAADANMVLIPAGAFNMGSNREENESMWRDANPLNPFGFLDQLYVNERPMHKVDLPAYLMDKYEVTNAQYRDFVIATKHGVPSVWVQNGYNISMGLLRSLPLDELRQLATDRFKLDMDVPNTSQAELLSELNKLQNSRDNLPVTGVTWADANDYCSAVGKRLPTEAEWEKAARGEQGNEYPWGNVWDPKKLRTMSDDQNMPYAEVGSYPSDKSVYGVYDMAGNVAEWTNDWFDAYPGADPANKSPNYGKVHRVVRGGMASSGHYDSVSVVFRNAKRNHLNPRMALIDLGFRCVKNAQ